MVSQVLSLDKSGSSKGLKVLKNQQKVLGLLLGFTLQFSTQVKNFCSFYLDLLSLASLCVSLHNTHPVPYLLVSLCVMLAVQPFAYNSLLKQAYNVYHLPCLNTLHWCYGEGATKLLLK